MGLFSIFRKKKIEERQSVADIIRETKETENKKEEPVTKSIIGFEKTYSFLSSEYRYPVKVAGKEYDSPKRALEVIKLIEMCNRVNKDAATRETLPTITEIGNKTLEEMTRTKFLTNKRLGEKLLGTGDKYLNDTTVENFLGRILMEIRQELLEKAS